MSRHHPGIKPSKRIKVLAKTNGACWYCGEPADTADHWIPFHISKKRKRAGVKYFGPKNGITNLVPACSSCNTRKGQMLVAEFRQIRAQRFNDPGFRFWGERVLPAIGY